ncbi:MAG TPA: dipeptide ABC transporter ATP-binding protein [Thermodesulfobacteriota bacterium]|nr:dipeptide ABC transporter ATP-binding protein [Thermodesulfobacteriota bacterium]
MEQKELVKVNNLKKYFPVKSGVFSSVSGYLKAVDGVDLTIYEGETFGLVGESGCGKTTLGKTVIRLHDPTEGYISFDGHDVTQLGSGKMRRLRRDMQIIFQDPYGSLNPRMKVEGIVGEGLAIHNIVPKQERRAEVKRLLDIVGLREDALFRYPHEFSGGQRQRIAIARALAVRPKFIVCDEPVSALDVSVQAQIINLLLSLQEEFKLTYLFISHDLRIVRHISDRVGVMYLGKIVELAESEELYRNPLHPYTKVLLSAVPVPDPEAKKNRIILSGDVPSPLNSFSGCSFHSRCPIGIERCQTEEPVLRDVGGGHMVACHLA